jgi:hypothetical protein
VAQPFQIGSISNDAPLTIRGKTYPDDQFRGAMDEVWSGSAD